MQMQMQMPSTPPHRPFHHLYQEIESLKKKEKDKSWRKLFRKYFAAPHIRQVTKEDITFANFNHSNIYNRQTITQEQIQEFKDITLPSSVTWKQFFLELVLLQEHMLNFLSRTLKKGVTLPGLKHPKKECVKCLVGVPYEEGENIYDYLFSRDLLNDECGIMAFNFDIVEFELLNDAHKNALQRLSSQFKSPPAYHCNVQKGQPSTGPFVCIDQGICAFNELEQQFELVFPSFALASMFKQCDQELDRLIKQAQEDAERFLQQKLVLTFQVSSRAANSKNDNSPSSDQDNLDALFKSQAAHQQLLKAIAQTLLTNHELRVLSGALMDDELHHLVIHCIRQPKWTQMTPDRQFNEKINYATQPKLQIHPNFLFTLSFSQTFELKLVSTQVYP